MSKNANLRVLHVLEVIINYYSRITKPAAWTTAIATTLLITIFLSGTMSQTGWAEPSKVTIKLMSAHLMLCVISYMVYTSARSITNTETRPTTSRITQLIHKIMNRLHPFPMAAQTVAIAATAWGTEGAVQNIAGWCLFTGLVGAALHTWWSAITTHSTNLQKNPSIQTEE